MQSESPAFVPVCDNVQILVVEDTAPVRELVVEILRGGGYEVSEAPDAGVALHLSAARRWDLLVLDIDLPDMSGLELHRHLSALQPERPLPVVFVTGRPSPQRYQHVAGLAIARLLAKPFSLAEILHAVANCLLADQSRHPC